MPAFCIKISIRLTRLGRLCLGVAPTVDDDDAGADQRERNDGKDWADHARLAKEQGGEHGAKDRVQNQSR